MLKNLKKFILAVSMLIFLLTLPLGAYAADNAGRAKDAYGLLSALGIAETEEDYAGTVTRAQFCDFTARLIKISGMVQTYYYSDVPANHDFADSVYSLSELGIVNGDTNGEFHPDEPITVNQAAAVLVKALNYYRVLERPVTYPVSYTSKAGRLKLFNGTGVTGDAALTFGDVYIILENTLNAPAAVYNNDDDLDTSHTAFERYYDIKKGRGICTADDLTTLSGSRTSSVGKNQIEIDGAVYGLSYKSAREFIGRRIDFYYNSDNEVMYARPYNNEIISLDYDDVTNFTVNRMQYFESGSREKLVSIASGADLIYNGTAYPDYDPKEFDFANSKGHITLIKNNDGRDYNCIIIEEYVTYVISHADEETKTLYYSNYRIKGYDEPGNIPERSVCFENTDTLEIERADGAAVTFDQLFANDAASVFASRDGSYVKIMVSPNKTNGKITAVNEDKLTVSLQDGTVKEYDTDNRDVVIGDILKIGFSGEFILNFNDEICGIVNYYGEAFTYGYLIKSYISDESGGEDMYIKLLASDGSIGVYSFTDKTKLDGVTYKKLADANAKLTARDSKTGSGYTKQQLIRFKLSADGSKLTYIDTAELGKGETTDNSLEMIYLSDTENKYRPNNRYVNRQLVIDQAGLVVFCVPRVFSGNPSEINSAEDDDYYVRYDLKGYYTKESIRVDAAVTDKDGGSSTCIVFPQEFGAATKAGGNTSYSSRNTYFYGMVDSVGETVNSSGDVVPVINLITDTDVVPKECKYDACTTKPVYSDTGAETQEVRTLQRGDAVKCFTDDAGIVRYTQTLYDVSRTDNGRFQIPALSNVASDGFSCGVIYSKSARAMKMMRLFDAAEKFDRSDALKTFNKDDYAVQTCAETAILYYVYDSETNKIRKGTANDIRDYVNNPSAPSVVYQREAYTIPKAVFIYN